MQSNGAIRPRSRSRSLAVLLLLLSLLLFLVTLSGCAGYVGAPGPADRLPPGVRSDTVEDPHVLLDAHGRRLADLPYTVENTFVSRPAGEKPGVRVTRVIRFGGDRRRYWARSRTGTWGPGGEGIANRTVVRWSNGTAIAINRTVGTRTTYAGTRDGVGLFYPEPTPGDFREGLYVLLATSDLSVRAATGEDELLLSGRIPERPWAVVRAFDRTRNPPDASVADARVQLIVTDDGLIRFWRVSWVVVRADGIRYRESWTVRVLAIGSTSIPRPDWVHLALANETAPTEVPGPIR
ncbi:MAG: hypothetical protein ABEI31_03520 [Halodesulfurarchaeum sp.]